MRSLTSPCMVYHVGGSFLRPTRGPRLYSRYQPSSSTDFPLRKYGVSSLLLYYPSIVTERLGLASAKKLKPRNKPWGPNSPSIQATTNRAWGKGENNIRSFRKQVKLTSRRSRRSLPYLSTWLHENGIKCYPNVQHFHILHFGGL